MVNNKNRTAVATAMALALLLILAYSSAKNSNVSKSSRDSAVELVHVAGAPTDALLPKRTQVMVSSTTEDTQLYEGIVIWARDGGKEEPCLLSGNARVAISTRGSLQGPTSMRVNNGAWSILAPPESSLEVHQLELFGEVLWPTSSSISLAIGDKTAIRVDHEPRTWFRDAASGENITNVSVMAATPSGSQHPGLLPHFGVFDPVYLPQSIATPVKSEHMSPGVSYFTSQGYCWAAVPDAGKISSVVMLEQAGNVEIRIAEQNPRILGCSIELFAGPSSRKALYSVAIGDLRQQYAISKIRQGDYRLELARSTGTASREVLFSHTISVDKDSIATVDLVLEEEQLAAATPVSFIVAGDERTLSSIRRLGLRPKRVRGGESEARLFLTQDDVVEMDFGVREYEPKLLLPGDYLLEVEPMGWYEEFAVPEDAVYLHEIALGEMQEYRLWLRDEAGSPLEANWSQVRSGHVAGLADLAVDGSSIEAWSTPMIFEAIRGPIMVSVSVPGFGLKRLHLDGGRKSEFDVSLTRPAEVQIELRSRSSVFSAPESWWGGVRPLSSSGEPVPARIEPQGSWVPGWHSSVLVCVESPGDLLLELPSLPGCNELGIRLALQVPAGASRWVLDVDSRTWVD